MKSRLLLDVALAALGLVAACAPSRGSRSASGENEEAGGCGIDELPQVTCPESREPGGPCPPTAGPFSRRDRAGRYDEAATRAFAKDTADLRRNHEPASDKMVELERYALRACCYAYCSKLAVIPRCDPPCGGGYDVPFTFCLDHPPARTSAPAEEPFAECPAALAPTGRGMAAGFDRGGSFDAETTSRYRRNYGPAHRCCYRATTFAGEFYE